MYRFTKIFKINQ